ncbi:MAG: glutamate-cysteine ligase family protein [Tissierellia bacterium]|nr:glutamate-cysteine ligase family protein [Tissierellia bacterium]
MEQNIEKRDRLIQYFETGEKRDGTKKLGLELEHFVLDSDSKRTVSYYGDEGVGQTMSELEEKGWKGYYNDEYILGLEKSPYTVSTEPGSQFEVAFEAREKVQDLEEMYLRFMEEVLPLFAEKSQELVALGYQPKTKIDEIRLLPKHRYDYMFAFLKNTGTMAHNMMKGTCAVQVTIDYHSEADMVRKYRLGSALSPILYTLYDNAYIFEGEALERHNIRQYIWENTDIKRSGVLPIAFDPDFSYGKYADFILGSKPIFFDDKGKLTSTGEQTFEEVFDPSIHGDDVIYHGISIVFPDLRLKRYLEFRMMDAVPYPLNLSAPALLKGLMYSEKNLDQLEKLFADISYQEVIDAKKSAAEKGMLGQYRGKSFYQWGEELIQLAENALTPEEKSYLKPLEENIAARQNPRDLFKRLYETKGIDAAIELGRIEVD